MDPDFLSKLLMLLVELSGIEPLASSLRKGERQDRSEVRHYRSRRITVRLRRLWGNWTNPKTEQVEKTFSIFTTVPNERFAEYHNRQPVILDPSEYDEWLAPAERPPAHLLRILPEEKMVITPAEPLAAQIDEGPFQESLFG
jgi:putative SOS response-associated peptidase YedK